MGEVFGERRTLDTWFLCKLQDVPEAFLFSHAIAALIRFNLKSVTFATFTPGSHTNLELRFSADEGKRTVLETMMQTITFAS